MSHLHLAPLHVTGLISNCARSTGFRFGNDTALVAVQHMLVQTIDLFQNAALMGLLPRNMFALGKVYSNSQPVIRHLRSLGITMVDTTVPEPGEFRSYFERDVERLWQVVLETLKGRDIKRILVLDDAGLCITNVPPEVLRRYEVCGVEQTTRGMFLLEQKPPPFAVISWARSAVKLQIGGPIFALCFLEKLSNDFLRDRSAQGKTFGVIGFGSIGSAVAKLAARQGLKVLFYDPAEDLPRDAALSSAISRAGSLEELMVSCDYVAGCTGRHPFQDNWPIRHKPGIKLLSASGGDHEFGAIIKDLRSKPNFEVDSDTWTISSTSGPSGPLQIAYLGYPYNFVSRAPEAVPTQIVQIETAGLLAALAQARIHLQVSEASPEHNHGWHRVAPIAQRFVYETWLKTMKEQGVNFTALFGYDDELLRAAQDINWLAKNSDPPVRERDERAQTIEELMQRFVGQRHAIKGAGER